MSKSTGGNAEKELAHLEPLGSGVAKPPGSDDTTKPSSGDDATRPRVKPLESAAKSQESRDKPKHDGNGKDVDSAGNAGVGVETGARRSGRTKRLAKTPVEKRKNAPEKSSVTGVPVPKATSTAKPSNPLRKQNWGEGPTVETLSEWMKDMMALLLANMKYWQKAAQKDDKHWTCRQQVQVECEKEWEQSADIETGEIYDEEEEKRIKASMKEKRKPIEAFNEKDNSNEKHLQYKLAQQAYEDFLYYQNEWNRRKGRPGIPVKSAVEKDYHVGGQLNDPYDLWIWHIIRTFRKFRIGNRNNVPKTLTPEQLFRYPDNVRKTTEDGFRRAHLNREYPSHERVMVDDELTFAVDHQVQIDEDLVLREKAEVDERRKRHADDDDAISKDKGRYALYSEMPGEQRDYTIYHACSHERTDPFKWQDREGKQHQVETSFETSAWGPAVTAGKWNPGKAETIAKKRYKKIRVYYFGQETRYKTDNEGNRILDQMTGEWQTEESDLRQLSRLEYRLDEEGQRIHNDQEWCLHYSKPIFNQGTEKYQNALPGRRNRARDRRDGAEFSDDDLEELDEIESHQPSTKRPHRGRKVAGKRGGKVDRKAGGNGKATGKSSESGPPEVIGRTVEEEQGNREEEKGDHLDTTGDTKEGLREGIDNHITGKGNKHTLGEEIEKDRPEQKKKKTNPAIWIPAELHELTYFTQKYVNEHHPDPASVDRKKLLLQKKDFMSLAKAHLDKEKANQGWKTNNRSMSAIRSKMDKDIRFEKYW